ncbi:MAG: SGNH/GDSL hydrolase family protein [bacterium]
MHKHRILSLGDCNTLGVQECRGNAYPERFARLLGAEVCNCGFTMSTLREAKYFFRDFYDASTNIVTLQYGLADSWETFRYSPYVLYYPDNPLRKIARKAVKKYKKTCRQLGLNNRFGTAPVVPPEQFSRGLAEIIAACRPDTRILLIEIVPHSDEARTPAILKYNGLLKKAAASDPRCRLLEAYDLFAGHPDTLYADSTHINANGHELIAQALVKLYQEGSVLP